MELSIDTPRKFIRHGESVKVYPIWAKHTQGAQELRQIEKQGPVLLDAKVLLAR